MNAQLEKVVRYEARIRELYEQKFNKADWEAKKPEAIKWFKKAKKQAFTEMFETKQPIEL